MFRMQVELRRRFDETVLSIRAREDYVDPARHYQLRKAAVLSAHVATDLRCVDQEGLYQVHAYSQSSP